ncbi:asparagine synthase (glutamine-hydrolyzing) [Thiolapillus brandeum]|uniref:asparagine synthase (glutamine-hydrolyzing) n=1 Tax=Thiolapillus brandeum TaxID=1076588 RepID=A0A7U6JHH1_9GAMM|nr:asparagine synthase (glutamine-hydrolyzing) [Thiolapillus brandeum]BAO43688.1 asparagine synthase, glutamine-hydrolyzing [Thiolapillus brandeum]
MCGITGWLASDMPGELDQVIHAMTDALAHRGPDDKGVWFNPEQGVALGHRRLAVVDLSPTGHQPMPSASGRYVLVFNGEIYNHQDLRRRIGNEGGVVSPWRGHSDTESLLAAVERWGLEATLPRLRGMFALALWDRRERELCLARDRMGEKPLYYGWCGGGFAFASELKALKQIPGFSNPVSRDVLCLYLRHAYVPAPYSIYEDIYKLEPGCMLRIRIDASVSAPVRVPQAPCRESGFEIGRYWALKKQVERGKTSSQKSEQEYVHDLESVLIQSISLQSVADVPLGVFLSGGVDSSLITALMQRHADQQVKTFTIGFEEQGYDEAVYARAVAEYLQTGHTELYVNARQAREVIPRLPDIYDEPFADSSQIPTFLVAQMARQHVTVALSGDGGDELFGGYNRYLWAPGIWRKFSLAPGWLRRRLVRAMIGASRGMGEGGRLGRLLSRRMPVARFGEKLQKLGQVLDGVDDLDELYLSMVSTWRDPGVLVIDGHEPSTLLLQKDAWPEFESAEQRMMYLDAMTYLPDDILCKVDRAAMAVSLETREPFLDYRVVEAAWRLPSNMKIRDGQGKWALRRILYKHVPRELIERPKQGFGIPLGQWLRGPLRDWAESLIGVSRLEREGYFRVEPLRHTWEAHLAGKRNHEHALWPVLMFQAWLDRQEAGD